MDAWGPPWLIRPSGVRQGLERLRVAGFDPVPNPWQVGLGVLRMWHRVLFRSDTIGTSRDPVRDTRRARVLHHRLVRAPFLVAERAVAPLDFSGLLQGPDRLIRHLIAAHHDRNQAVYDLELLQAHPGALDALIACVQAIVDGTHPRAGWLKDLVVHEGYHASLLDAALRARGGELRFEPHERDDPDLCFGAYLAWCARQPPTFAETLRLALRGRFTLSNGAR